VKILVIALLSLVVGFVGGLELEKVLRAPAEVQQLVESQFREQYGITAHNIAVFQRLQAGDVDKTNSLMARQLALYHHLYKEQDVSSPQGPRLIPLIEAASAGSPVLKAELEKPLP
jgi:hypothetical protein